MIIEGMRLVAFKDEDTNVISWWWHDEDKFIGSTQRVEVLTATSKYKWHYRTEDELHYGYENTRKEALIRLCYFAKCPLSERKRLKPKVPKRGKSDPPREPDFRRRY